MDLYRLALRNIAGNAFRSWVVALCALLISSLAVGTSLIMLGAQSSLHLAIERLGADLIVVPEGTTSKMESALLMGRPTRLWMPRSTLESVAAIPGVQTVSPQVYLASLPHASCCSVSEMFLVAYDPKTDFVVKPWLEKTLGSGLQLGEAIGGRDVYVPAGEQDIRLYGYHVTLKANMEPTGTGLDQTLFLTMATAREMARVSMTKAEQPLEIPRDSLSAVMVRLEPGGDPDGAALEIRNRIRGVTPIVIPQMFQSYRIQLKGLVSGVLAVLIVTLLFSVLLIGLVFSMAANERRREMGILRAMGARRSFVFKSMLFEASLLALDGGAVGIALTFLGVVLFRRLIIAGLGIPFLVPPLPVQLLLGIGGLGLSLLSVTLAALLPAYRISHLDPSTAMRE